MICGTCNKEATMIRGRYAYYKCNICDKLYTETGEEILPKSEYVSTKPIYPLDSGKYEKLDDDDDDTNDDGGNIDE